MAREFLKSVQGMSVAQLAWLFEERQFDSLLVYNLAENSVRKATLEDMPWQAAWWLTWGHRKFLQKPSGNPPWSKISQGLDEPVTRLCWKALCQDKDFAHAHLRTKKKVAEYTHPKPPSLKAWMGKQVEDLFMGVVACGKGIALREAMAVLED